MRALLALAVLAGCGGAQPAPVKSAELNRGGAAVKVEDALVAGYVVLAEFWSESCAACTVVEGKIAEQIANQPHVIVRKVDVGDGFTPAAKAYDVGTLPHVNVYDTRRRLRYRLIGPQALRAPELARELLREP